MNNNYITNEIRKALGDEYNVEYKDVPKNNVVRKAVVITKTGANIGSSIYYDEEWDDDKIVAHVVEVHKNNQPNFNTDTLVSDITNWEYVSQRIVPVLFNQPKSVYPDTVVTKPFVSDIGILFKVVIGEGNDGVASIKVSYDLLNHWGITVDELFEKAKENLNKKIVIKDMGAMLSEMTNGLFDERRVDPGLMSVVSVSSYVDGASTIMLIPELVKNGELEKHDYYIIPSSIHECILIDPQNILLSDLNMMIRDVNSTALQIEEFLSNYALKYDAESDQIERA